jgi:hypothetical protein
MASASFITPANPAITSLKVPGRTTERHSPQPSMGRAFDQIAHLRPTQGASTKIMIPLQECFPQTGDFTFTASYSDQLNNTQFLQITANRLNLLKGLILFTPGLKQPLDATLWQRYHAFPMQFQQSNTATHLFGLAGGIFPVKPLTYLKGKASTGNRWLSFHCTMYLPDYFIRKILTANQHGEKLPYWHLLCPAKKCGTWSGYDKGVAGAAGITMLAHRQSMV